MDKFSSTNLYLAIFGKNTHYVHYKTTPLALIHILDTFIKATQGGITKHEHGSVTFQSGHTTSGPLLGLPTKNYNDRAQYCCDCNVVLRYRS